MKRLLIDATSTIETGLNTGIQRVVRNICQYVTECARDDGVECHVVAFDGRRFRLVKDLSFIRNQGTPKKTTLRRLVNKIKSIVIRCLPVTVYSWRRRFKKMVVIAPRWNPAEGDVLLLPDATWNYYPWNAVSEAHQAKVKILHVIYDLLPLQHPEFFDPNLVADFKSWWEISSNYLDARFCISESVADDVRSLLPETAKSESIMASFPLGNDFIPMVIDDPGGKRKSELIPAGEGLLFLMVGTLEPRKNHAFVIDAFDKVWSQGGSDIRLLIIGRRGWQSEQIAQRICSHPRFGSALLWLDDCSDADLEICYQCADALIAASIYEGYGLPIIEAESRGLPVLASDIKVFREVANSDVQFFKLTNADQLAEQLRQFNTNKKPAISTVVAGMTWQASGEYLYTLIKSSLKN